MWVLLLFITSAFIIESTAPSPSGLETVPSFTDLETVMLESSDSEENAFADLGLTVRPSSDLGSCCDAERCLPSLVCFVHSSTVFGFFILMGLVCLFSFHTQNDRTFFSWLAVIALLAVVMTVLFVLGRSKLFYPTVGISVWV